MVNQSVFVFLRFVGNIPLPLRIVPVLDLHDIRIQVKGKLVRDIVRLLNAVLFEENGHLPGGGPHHLVERKPVRLIGAGIYSLFPEDRRQLTLEDFLEESSIQEEADRKEMLDSLYARYQLDFAGHLEQIYRGEILHKTVEYMRKHYPGTGREN